MALKKSWILSALDALDHLKVEHRNYKQTRNRLASACHAVFKGEVIVLVGPTRVGKTRCIRDALGIPDENLQDDKNHMRVVIVEAGNDSTSGEFSTKAFVIDCLRAIRHPIYGMAAEDDPWGQRLISLLDRTPERTLRHAFEWAITLRKTEFLVIDEAHHVQYVAGGKAAAARVLDSWKCLANRTKVKLVLAGSYHLLSLLMLAPHLIGRQLPLEFPRYRADRKPDIEAWEQLLRKFSEPLSFPDHASLSQWNRLLFEGSLGRTGGLSLWLRSCLADMNADGSDCITLAALEASRLPMIQEGAILEEILEGENNLIRFRETVRAGNSATTSDAKGASPPPSDTSKTKKPRGQPFRRNPKRHALGGRA